MYSTVQRNRIDVTYESGPPTGPAASGARGSAGVLAEVPVAEVLDESDALRAREASEMAPQLAHVAQHQRIRVEHNHALWCCRRTPRRPSLRCKGGVSSRSPLPPAVLEELVLAIPLLLLVSDLFVEA